jgi:NADPH2:quinone reductase
VGLIACQWGKALGFRMIGTAGSDAKCQLAIANGAEHCINYSTDDFLARVKEITGGKGLKVVYDSVGKDTWDKSLDCLRPFGLMATFGNASGAVPPFFVRHTSNLVQPHHHARKHASHGRRFVCRGAKWQGQNSH